MQETLTITLPSEIKAALDDLTKSEGILTNELIHQAIKDYLFIRKFRALRSSMLQKAHAEYTDEEIFNLVS
jgi:predicted transcriptional regulator